MAVRETTSPPLPRWSVRSDEDSTTKPEPKGDGTTTRRRGRPTGGDDGTKDNRTRIDLRSTWQILAGSILVPLGVVLILISWYGAAHTSYVQQQIPYLVSGSFVGLGFIILGGLLYWAHWLYRIYDQSDLQHEEMLRTMEQALRAITERLFADRGTGSPEASGARTSGSVRGAAAYEPLRGDTAGGEYVATAAGSVYHSPSCPVIAHHAEGTRPLGGGEIATMTPCRICLPHGEGPEDRENSW